MTNREQLISAVKRIAWGYILLHLHFNLGTLDILPDWLGYWMMLSTLPVLALEEESAGLLKPFAIILIVWNVITWAVTAFGGSFDGGVIELLVTVVNLYFHFQLLTNLAAISEKCGCPETKRLRILRIVQTSLTTILALPLQWLDFEWLAYLLLVAALVVVIWICSILFSLRRSLEEIPDEGPEETE